MSLMIKLFFLSNTCNDNIVYEIFLIRTEGVTNEDFNHERAYEDMDQPLPGRGNIFKEVKRKHGIASFYLFKSWSKFRCDLAKAKLA